MEYIFKRECQKYIIDGKVTHIHKGAIVPLHGTRAQFMIDQGYVELYLPETKKEKLAQVKQVVNPKKLKEG